METVFGILGIAGGLLCLAGDILLDYEGKGNVTLGKYGFIESNWNKMSAWRFKLSAVLAAAGVPLYFLGFTALAMQMTDETFALGYWIVCLIGSAGGVFMHGLLCVFPILYKAISVSRTFEETENILNSVYNAIKIPFFFHYIFLVVISSILAGYAIVAGYLSLPVWFIVFTPLCTMLVGVTVKTVFKREFPGVTSFGIAMVGLMAII